MSAEEAAALKKQRQFKKFVYRGIDLDKLLDMSLSEVIEVLPARIQRRFSRGLKRQHTTLLQKLRKAKQEAGPMDKPAPVKTHLRNMPILPDMIGNVVGVYNGKMFTAVEVKPEMVGHYLGEFSITYKPTLHRRAGLAASTIGRFVPV